MKNGKRSRRTVHVSRGLLIPCLALSSCLPLMVAGGAATDILYGDSQGSNVEKEALLVA